MLKTVLNCLFFEVLGCNAWGSLFCFNNGDCLENGKCECKNGFSGITCSTCKKLISFYQDFSIFKKCTTLKMFLRLGDELSPPH